MIAYGVWRIACGVLLLTATGAPGEEKPLRAAVHVYKGLNGKEWADVVIGARVAFTIRSWASGLSPSARAERITQRLNPLLARGLKAQDMRLEKPGAEWVIYGFRQVIVTVTFEDTWQTAMSGDALAREWMQGVIKSLSENP